LEVTGLYGSGLAGLGSTRLLLSIHSTLFAGGLEKDIRATKRTLLKHDALNMKSNVFDLSPQKVRSRKRRSYVRFEQTCAGLPVFASSVVVQLDKEKEIEYLSSDIVDDTQLADIYSTFDLPVIADADAIKVLQSHDPSVELWSNPELMCYSPAIVGNVGPLCLVWCIETASEVVLINAISKDIVLRYPLHTGLINRLIFDLQCQRNWDYTYLVRKEGELEYGTVSDVDLAYRYVGDAYDFFLHHHGRDGLDNEGSPVMCLTGYSPHTGEDADCSFFGAFWSQSGRYLAFGPGCVFDDVVAHEYTHGITQHMSGIIYLNESGAINEHFSDVWGEFVDQTNAWGDDSEEVKWLIGEDMVEGGFRSMKDPTRDSYPDRMGSEYWRLAPPNPIGEDDYGWVHYNNGVGNKLCYLLTQGDTFNGYTIDGMGIDMIADLYYEVQMGLLVKAPNYADLYFALKRAAANLGWTARQKENLEHACKAVEIASEYRKYMSADVPHDIPDGETTVSLITIDDYGVLSDLNVKIDVAHARLADLIVTLTSPSGTSVRLVDDTAAYAYGYGYGFYGTLFDDQATHGIGEGYEPFTGSFRPLEALSAFNGENATGIWRLEIADQASQAAGRLFGWSIELK